MPKVQSSKATKNLLKQFNSIKPLDYINLSSMVVNKPYRVTAIRKTETKFGDRLSLDLDYKVKVFLPERYNRMSDDEIAVMGGGNYVLINRGTEGKAFKLEIELAVPPAATTGNKGAARTKVVASGSKPLPTAGQSGVNFETDVEDDDDDGADDETPLDGVEQEPDDFNHVLWEPAASTQSQYGYYLERDQARQ